MRSVLYNYCSYVGAILSEYQWNLLNWNNNFKKNRNYYYPNQSYELFHEFIIHLSIQILAPTSYDHWRLNSNWKWAVVGIYYLSSHHSSHYNNQILKVEKKTFLISWKWRYSLMHIGIALYKSIMLILSYINVLLFVSNE